MGSASQFLLVFCVFVSLLVRAQEQQNTPYEFAFKLSNQHRQEKKDLDGIVTGEYGYESANGCYYSVKYATDMLGRFNIISRKRTCPPRVLPTPKPIVPEIGPIVQNEPETTTLPPPPPPTEPTTTTTTTTERVKIYQFNYTVNDDIDHQHHHLEMGFSDTSKMGDYFWDGPDGYRRIITYNADDQGGYRPVLRQIPIPV